MGAGCWSGKLDLSPLLRRIKESISVNQKEEVPLLLVNGNVSDTPNVLHLYLTLPIEQIELNDDIRESERLLEDERKHAQRVNSRARAQQLVLNQLGLTEAEAVEYLMMLSREDEQYKFSEPPISQAPSGLIRDAADHAEHGGGDHDEAESIFTFDDSNQCRLSPSPSPQHHSIAPSSSRLMTRALWPNSNVNVQLSNSLPPDLNSGFAPSLAAPSASYSINGSVPSTPASSFDDHEIFPSASSSWASKSVSSVHFAGSRSRGCPSIVGSTPSPPASSSSILSLNASSKASSTDAEDEELNYVLQLSLAEARSRGEGV